MGYQALLFCPDEKLARVVSQVFGELDFTIEPVHEPFAAVKKLMAQRFDAIVVDCENEQNASLLFKSARNSSSNQSSLAIALVEGQAGVAKAYRIGANLVLTKPINVEQAKGTLRVARGLLRKNSDAAGTAAAPAPAKPAPATASFASPKREAAPAAPPKAIEIPEFVDSAPASPAVPMPASLPTMAAAAVVEETTASVAAPATALDSAPPTPISAHSSVAVPAAASTPGLAAATAPAKESPVASAREATSAPVKEVAKEKESKPVEQEPANVSAAASISVAAETSSAVTGSAPTFAALNVEASEGSGGNKKFLVAAAVVLVMAGLGYVGYGKFGKSAAPAPASQPVSAAPVAAQPAPVAPSTPASASTSTVAAPASSSLNERATTSAATTPAPKASPAPVEKPSPAVNNALNSAPNHAPNYAPMTSVPAVESPAKKPSGAPIVVKSGSTATKPQADESAPPPTSAVASVSAGDANLSGLMSTSNVSKPSLAMIRISQGVSQGLVIKRVQPKYPAAALAVHTQGAVQIEATISKDGNVTNVKVLSGDRVLAQAAAEAVRQWRYKPYYLDGQPVEIQTQITVNFKAD